MAITHDSIGIRGYGIIEIHDAVTGALLAEQRYDNVIVDYVRAQIVQAFKGAATSLEVTHIAIGTDGTAALRTDTALGAEVIRSVPTAVIDYSAYEVGFKLFLSASQGNGSTFREIGLFDAPSGGNMFARSTSFAPIAKNSAITITFTHIIRYD
jgi:hypothetical protein